MYTSTEQIVNNSGSEWKGVSLVIPSVKRMVVQAHFFAHQDLGSLGMDVVLAPFQ